MFRLSRFRRYIKHSRQCLTKFPNTSKFVKNTPRRVVILTLFSVFGNVVKHGFSFIYYLKISLFLKQKRISGKIFWRFYWKIPYLTKEFMNGLHEDSFWKRGNNLVPRVSRDPENEVGEAIGKLESGLFACAFIDFLNMSVNVFMLYIFRHDPSPCHAFALLFNWPVTFFPVKTIKKTS